MKTKYLHTMVRVRDIEASKRFYCDLLGLEEIRRYDNEAGKFTLVFLAPPGQHDAPIELTHNWDPDEDYTPGRSFAHPASPGEALTHRCRTWLATGATINRPPRDGRMAFVVSPDGISIELLQAEGSLPPQEPWASMANTGTW